MPTPTNVPLNTNQIRFILDMMMGCPLGHTNSYSEQNDVIAEDLYNHLDQHLKTVETKLEKARSKQPDMEW